MLLEPTFKTASEGSFDLGLLWLLLSNNILDFTKSQTGLFQIFKASSVAEWLTLPTSDHEVLGLNSTNSFIRKALNYDSSIILTLRLLNKL